MKASAAISALIRWINDQLRKAPIKFLEIHRLEISWVNANNNLNAAIAQALNSNNFSITVNNYPAYNINIEKIRHIDANKIAEIDTSATNLENKVDSRTQNNTLAKNANALFKSALPTELQSRIKPEMSDDEMKQIIENWVLYDGQQPQQNQQAKPITGDDFKNLCTNILETEKALQALKPISDSLTKAADALKKRIDATATTQQGTNQNNQNNQNNNNNPQPPTNGLSDAQQALTKLANVYAAVVTNTISNKFYKESYSVYRDIVQAYNQEGKPAGNPTATTDANNPQGGGNENANK